MKKFSEWKMETFGERTFSQRFLTKFGLEIFWVIIALRLEFLLKYILDLVIKNVVHKDWRRPKNLLKIPTILVVAILISIKILIFHGQVPIYILYDQRTCQLCMLYRFKLVVFVSKHINVLFIASNTTAATVEQLRANHRLDVMSKIWKIIKKSPKYFRMLEDVQSTQALPVSNFVSTTYRLRKTKIG